MSKLLDLAARCEGASGANFALECDIAEAVSFDRQEEGPISRPPPNYTASIDSALTLVPDGCGWFAGWGQTRPDEPLGGARITRNARFIGSHANYDAIAEAEAATPALALCAAALRARAAMENTGQ